ncbi:MAG: 5'-nucleotidase C-terminal domain-containing protein [Candidatus Carbobacillus altaicus]|nr:5'-nucleotidase C-terminal domain-containing protein [Candidatus Carbobacillus altaicus]
MEKRRRLGLRRRTSFRPVALVMLALLLLASSVMPSVVQPAYAADPAADVMQETNTGWQLLFKEDFENGTKDPYARGDVTLRSGIWTLDDALIGGLANDKKNGSKAVRMINSGTLTMNFDKTVTQSVYVELYHALYGNEKGGEWKLQYSLDQGGTWIDLPPIGSKDATVAPTATLTPIAFQLDDVNGPVRFQIAKTDGSKNRINIDDVAVYTKEADTGQPVKDTKALHIIHTNDIHGNIKDFAKLAKVVEKTRDAHAFTLFIDDGDQFSGDPVTDLAKGKPMVELFNAMGLDAMTIGNHDFDYGPQTFQERRVESTYPWLAANVRKVDAAQTPITQPEPYVVIQIDQQGNRTLYHPGEPYTRSPDILTVGLLSITQNPPATAPKNTVGLEFHDYDSTIRQYLDLKDQVDVFILASHIGYPDDRVLAQKFPEFDLIIGGHSHTTLTKPVFVNGVPIVQTGSHMDNIGHTVLELNKNADGQYTVVKGPDGTRRVSGELLSTRTLTDVDPNIQAIVDQYTNAVKDQLDEVIGKTNQGLTQSGKTTGDAPLGNFWTDAMRAYVKEVEKIDLTPTVAFMNVGGIRADIKPGDITRRNIFEIEPFSNFISVIEMNGKNLKEILKYSFTRDGRNSIDLQVSGMNYTIVTDATGQFKDVIATIDDQPLQDDATVYVLVPDYIGSGGSGYQFPELGDTLYTAVWLVRDALEWYAKKLTDEYGSVEAQKEGRIAIQKDASDMPDIPLISIADARQVQEKTIVHVQGTVTTQPGAWGAKGFYIQDDTAGLYVYTNDDYKVKPGDVVDVIGATKSYNGEWEIDSPSKVIIVGQGSLPQPKTIQPDDVPNVQGEVVRLAKVTIKDLKEVNSFGTFEFTATTDDGKSVTVRVDNRTGLAYKDFTFKDGDVVDVVGIASIYNTVYQIKPRWAEDITLPQEDVQTPETWSLRILHTNDTHSHLENATRLATLIKQARAEAEANSQHVLLLDAGDVFTGTLYFTKYEGLADAEFMNQIGYQAMTLGNHEFDKGPEGLAKFLNAIQFPVVAANIDFGNDPNLKDYVSSEIAEGGAILPGHIYPAIILEVGGKRVGLFGLTTEETKAISSPGEHITFLPAIDTARQMVDALKERNVDFIIALTHIGYSEDVKLAEAVSGIDVIVGGHSHTQLDTPKVISHNDGSKTLIVQANEHRKYLGELDVTLGENGGITSFAGQLLPTSAKDDSGKYIVEPDPDAQKLIDQFDEELKELMSEVVGQTDVDLNGERDYVRTQETNLGNLIADGMVAFAKQFVPETQAAITNGGGIRASIPKGDITLGQVMTTLPFGNVIVTLKVTGAELKEALENGVSAVENKHGRFPQVSGLRFTYDSRKPAGERIVDVEINTEEGYKPLDPDAVYTIATNKFMADGGDFYTMLKKAQDDGRMTNLFYPDYEVFVSYLEAYGPISEAYAAPEGRIVDLATQDKLEPILLADLLKIGGHKDNGPYLVNDAGFSLYIYTKDQPGGVSVCTGTCADNWPPLTVTEEVYKRYVEEGIKVGEGIEKDKVGFIKRPDSDLYQVTYNGWPLYTFIGDKAPGETNGQGKNDVWYLIRPNGSLIVETMYTVEGFVKKENGITATVHVKSKLPYSNRAVVIFQLVKKVGSSVEPRSIVALEKSSWHTEGETFIAHFNEVGDGYEVRVYVLDSFSSDPNIVEKVLAEPQIYQVP